MNLTMDSNRVLVNGEWQGNLLQRRRSRRAGGPRVEWLLSDGFGSKWLGWNRRQAIDALRTLLPLAVERGESLQRFVMV